MRTLHASPITIALLLVVSPAPADQVPVATLAHGCMACHAAGTASRSASVPSLAGRDADVLLELLRAYRADDTAESTSMHRLTRGYSDQELEAVARYFAEQE